MFKIGQFVYLKQDLAYSRTVGWAPEQEKAYKVPGKLMILGKHTDTCYAGTQVFYDVRMYSDKGVSIIRFSEIELTDDINFQV